MNNDFSKVMWRPRAAPSTGIGIGIGPIPAFLVVSESVKHVIQVPILLLLIPYMYYVLQ